MQRQMMQELEREPTVDELAEKVDMTPARVREILRISLDPLCRSTLRSGTRTTASWATSSRISTPRPRPTWPRG